MQFNPALMGSRMRKLSNRDTPEGQEFYKGVVELAKSATTRPYLTPLLLLVIKHYADRFNLVEYFNGLIT